MTDYQTLTLTETHEKLIVGMTEYPLTLAGIFYIKFINYQLTGCTYTPIKFITLLPQNILKRENIWTIEEEDEIRTAAQNATEREATMAEYRVAAEKEMKRRSEEIKPEVAPTKEDDENIIDPEFNTPMNPHDPNYG